MAFDLNVKVDQSTVNESEQGSMFTIMQYSYGDPKMLKLGGLNGFGGFFIPFDSMPGSEDSEDRNTYIEALNAAGWTEDDRTTNSGDEIKGLYKRDIEAAVLFARYRWEASDRGNDRKAFFPATWPAYNEAKEQYDNVRGRAHVMVVVRGMEEFEPIVISFGPSAQMAWRGTKKSAGILPKYMRTLLAKGEELTKEKLPWHSFYLHMGAAQDAKGKPVFTQSHDNSLCLPTFYLAAESAKDVTQEHLDTYYVGTELLTGRLTDLYKEHEEWAAAWDEGNLEREEPAEDETHEEETVADGQEAVAAVGL